MISVLGWLLAAFLFGLILGAWAMWRFMIGRPLEVPSPRAIVAGISARKSNKAPTPDPGPGTAVVSPEARENMIKDFMENEGLSLEEAKVVADQLAAAAAERLAGGDVAW